MLSFAAFTADGDRIPAYAVWRSWKIGADGSFMLRTKVVSSFASALAMFLNVSKMGDFAPTRTRRSKVNFTASALKGEPSVNVTPLRSLNVIARLSELTAQLSARRPLYVLSRSW